MIKASIPWNCKQIHKMVMNKSLVFDNAIQRGFVWDNKRSSLLIDSILRKYPIPPFYTIKDGRTVKTAKGVISVFDALDGKQRCTTISMFKNNEIILTGLQPITLEDGSDFDLNGQTYETLPDELKDEFDSYSLTVYFFTDITDEEIMEMMSRLNNGKPLSTIENSRIKAKYLVNIQTLAKHPIFINRLSETAINSYFNEDIVIKSYILLMTTDTCLDNKIVRPTFENLVVTPEIETTLTTVFDKMNHVYELLLEKKKTAIAKKFTKRTHFISLTPFFKKCIDNNISTEDITEFIIHLFTKGKPTCNQVYNNNCKDGSNHAEKVTQRLNAIAAEYQTFTTA